MGRLFAWGRREHAQPAVSLLASILEQHKAARKRQRTPRYVRMTEQHLDELIDDVSVRGGKAWLLGMLIVVADVPEPVVHSTPY